MSGEWIIGTHLSFTTSKPEAVFAEVRNCEINCAQIFLGAPLAGLKSEVDKSVVDRFKRAHSVAGNIPIYVHAPYSINLATKSVEDCMPHFKRMLYGANSAHNMGLSILFHPGSTMGLLSMPDACALIAKRVSVIHKQSLNSYPPPIVGHGAPLIVYENGHGSPKSNVVGKNLDELRMLIEGSEYKDRVGICIDTAHLYSSGYDLTKVEVIDSFFRDFDRLIGPQYLRAMHINDCSSALASGADKHAAIGTGLIGLPAFQWIMNNPRFMNLPMITETHLESASEIKKEIALLRSLCRFGR